MAKNQTPLFQLTSFESVSIQRKFSILFLIASIVPMALLDYVYLSSFKIGHVDIPNTGLSIAMFFMAVGVLVGYFSIRSLLVKITNISNQHRKAIEPFLSKETIEELRQGEDEIVVLGRSFAAVIKQLEKDIKELEIKNEKLKTLDQLKDEFVNNVSHELRVPLTIIQESVCQISEGIYGAPNEGQLKYLNMCLRNIHRLSGLIDNLLDIAKIEQGKFEIVKKNIDLLEVVKEVIQDFTPKAIKKGLDLELHCAVDKIKVFADRDKIVQVLLNLVGNAYKFTNSGYIRIFIREDEHFVECCVEDSGPGIAPEELSNLFSKFHQIRPQASLKERGTGLGLVICKNIIELHKGNIFAQSVKLKGARFTFTLPRMK